jgi:heterodisulfide reductase subunit C
MNQKTNHMKKINVPVYPLRSVSKLNYIPETMFPNAKSLVQTGYFVTSNKRIEKKREKIGLPKLMETNKYIKKLLQGKHLNKLVGEE